MNAIEKSVINRALAVMQRRNLPIGRCVEMKRLCSVYGAAYTAVYREVNGLWRFEQSVKEVPGSGASARTAAIVIDPSLIEDASEICAWCHCAAPLINGERIIYAECSRCKNCVCLGRTVGANFKCCERCGASGRLSGYIETCEASARTSPARGMTTVADKPALAGSSHLQLTAGRKG